MERLEELSKVSAYGKPLLSYHVNGGEDSKGLMELGLVESERGVGGRTKLRITTLGKMLLLVK